MDIWAVWFLVFFGALFYIMLFKAPPSDRVLISDSEAEVFHIQQYLEANGIKSRSMRRYHPCGMLVNPSLHVLRIEDNKRAVQLIQDLKTRINSRIS